jgi:hypothetical protein
MLVPRTTLSQGIAAEKGDHGRILTDSRIGASCFAVSNAVGVNCHSDLSVVLRKAKVQTPNLQVID